MAGELFFFLRRRLSFLAFGLKNANFGKNVNDVVIARGDRMGIGGGGLFLPQPRNNFRSTPRRLQAIRDYDKFPITLSLEGEIGAQRLKAVRIETETRNRLVRQNPPVFSLFFSVRGAQKWILSSITV